MTKVSSMTRRKPNGFYEVGVQIGPFQPWHWVQLKARRSDVAKREAPKMVAVILYARAREWGDRIKVLEREATALVLLGHKAQTEDINGHDLEGMLP